MDLHDSMIKLLESNNGDVTITSDDGKDIKVISAIICNVTDYFNVALRNDVLLLKAPINYISLKYILRYVYSLDLEHTPDDMTNRDKFKLLDIARLWLLPKLEKHIADEILCVKDDEMFKIYRLADEFASDELRQRIADKIKYHTIQPHDYCFDAFYSKPHRFCCRHVFKHASLPESNKYCYYQTHNNMIITGDTRYCCQHKKFDSGINYEAEIDKLNEKQLKHLLVHLVKYSSYK